MRIAAARAARAMEGALKRGLALYLRIQARYVSRATERDVVRMVSRRFHASRASVPENEFADSLPLERIQRRYETFHREIRLTTTSEKTRGSAGGNEKSAKAPEQTQIFRTQQAGPRTSADIRPASRGRVAPAGFVSPLKGVVANSPGDSRDEPADSRKKRVKEAFAQAAPRVNKSPRKSGAVEPATEAVRMAERRGWSGKPAAAIIKTAVTATHEESLRLTTRLVPRTSIIQPVLNRLIEKTVDEYSRGPSPVYGRENSATTRDFDSNRHFAGRRTSAEHVQPTRPAARSGGPSPRKRRVHMRYAPMAGDAVVSRKEQAVFAAQLLDEEHAPEPRAHGENGTGDPGEMVSRVWSELLRKAGGSELAAFTDRIHREIERKLYMEGERRACQMTHQ